MGARREAIAAVDSDASKSYDARLFSIGSFDLA
jgi:hypothetical protein